MISEQIKEFIAGTDGIVEATSFERHSLWENYHERFSWVENLSGYGVCVGYLAEMPICLSVLWSMIDGKKILFIDATSQVVDWRMIDEWLKENLPGVPKTDATNFSHVLR